MMIECTTREITAFAQHAKRKDILKAAGISRARFERLRDDPEFMQLVNEMRTEILSDVVRKLEQHLADAADELSLIIGDSETAPQIKLNGIQILFNSYSRLADRVDILRRLDALEKLQESHNEPF